MQINKTPTTSVDLIKIMCSFLTVKRSNVFAGCLINLRLTLVDVQSFFNITLRVSVHVESLLVINLMLRPHEAKHSKYTFLKFKK